MFHKIKSDFFRYPAIFLLTGLLVVVSISPYLWPAFSENANFIDSISNLLLESPLWNAFLIVTLLFLGSSLEKTFGAPTFIVLFVMVGISASFYMSYFSPPKLASSSSLYVAWIMGMNIGILLKKNRFMSQKHKIALVILLALLLLFIMADPVLPVLNVLVGIIVGIAMSLSVKPQSFSKLVERKWGASLLQGIMILILTLCLINSTKLINYEAAKSGLQAQLGEWTAKIDVARTQQKREGTATEGRVVEKSSKMNSSHSNPIYVTGDPLYNSILESLLNLDNTVKLGLKYDSDRVFETLQQVLNDHPEIFYFDHSNSRYWTNGQLELGYNYSKPDIERMREEIQLVVTEIFNLYVGTNQSDFEKVKAIHDYIVLNTRYDEQNYKADTIPDESFHIVGTLLNQTAVCDGYAKTMQYLLNLVGVEVRHVTGTGNGEPHAWNKVKIDGEWFNLDATWDDPVPDQGGNVSYRYFLVDDQHLRKDHRWEEELYPTAEATTYMHISRNE